MKIGFLIRSVKENILKNCLYFLDGTPYEIKVTYETGVHFMNYFYWHLLSQDFDIVILLDEDCYVFDNKRIVDLVDYFIENDYSACGMPDGGVSLRVGNPVSINPFFLILNLKKLRNFQHADKMMKRWAGINDIKNMDGFKFDESFKILVPDFANKIPVNYDYDDYFNYFFYWIVNNNGKMLYLDADTWEKDNTSTLLKDHNGVYFLIHAWYTRKSDRPSHRARYSQCYDFCKMKVESLNEN